MRVVSIRASAMRRRNRITHPEITFDHDWGGLSPHKAAARDSIDTGAPRRTVRAAITARSRGASGNPTIVECQRSKNAHLHEHPVTPAPISVKTAYNGPIPNRRAPLTC